MKTETAIKILDYIIIPMVIVGILVGIIYYIGDKMSSPEYQKNTQLTYDKCCGGQMCTDTYYSEEDGKCHSAFEYNDIWFTKWYVTIPAILGVIIILVLLVQFVIPKGLPAEPEQLFDSVYSQGEPQ